MVPLCLFHSLLYSLIHSLPSRGILTEKFNKSRRWNNWFYNRTHIQRLARAAVPVRKIIKHFFPINLSNIVVGPIVAALYEGMSAAECWRQFNAAQPDVGGRKRVRCGERAAAQQLLQHHQIHTQNKIVISFGKFIRYCFFSFLFPISRRCWFRFDVPFVRSLCVFASVAVQFICDFQSLSHIKLHKFDLIVVCVCVCKRECSLCVICCCASVSCLKSAQNDELIEGKGGWVSWTKTTATKSTCAYTCHCASYSIRLCLAHVCVYVPRRRNPNQ